MHRAVVSRALIVLAAGLLIVTACSPPGEQGSGDDAIPIRDESGSSLTQAELIARLSEGSWAAEPIHDEDGHVLEIRVLPFGQQPEHRISPGAMVIDGSVPMRDEDGQELSMDDFMRRMNEGGWAPEPVLDEHGKMVELLLRRDDGASPMQGPPPHGEMLSFGGERERWLGTTLPELDLVTIDGRRLNPSVFEGRAVVLNFWFRACKPCLMEIPELNKLVQEFPSEKVVFVALGLDSVDETREAVKGHPFAYEIVASTQELQRKLGIQSYPTHLVYGLDGRCAAVFSGYSPGMGKMLAHEIEQVLKVR